VHENLAERRFPPDYTQVLRDNTAENDDKASPRARPHVATRCRGRRSPWQGVSAGGPALGHERFVKALPRATGPVARLCHGRQGLWRRLAVDLVATEPSQGRAAGGRRLARPCQWRPGPWQGRARGPRVRQSLTECGRPGPSKIVAKGRALGRAVPRAAGPLATLCRDRPGPWEGLTVGGRQIGAALGKTGPRAVGPWATHCQGRPAPAKGLPIAAGPLATPSQRWPGPWQTLPRAGRPCYGVA